MSETKTMFILAVPGVIVPMMGPTRRKVPQGDPKSEAHLAVRVPVNRYYQRHLRDGAAVKVTETAVQKARGKARRDAQKAEKTE